MPPLAPAYMLNTVEVVTKAERYGEQRRNVFHYRYLSGRPTLAQLTQLCLEVESGIIDKQEDFCSLGTTWFEIQATDIHDGAGLQFARPITRLAVGPVNNLPGACSHCLTKRTANRGRSKRGRFYLFDLAEDYANGDDVNPLYIGVITQLCNELFAPRVSGYFLAAVGSRTLSGSTPITSMTFDMIMDTQTRRGKNRGS